MKFHDSILSIFREFNQWFPSNDFSGITTELLPNRQQVRVRIPNQARLADIDLTMNITTAAGRGMPSYQLPRMEARHLGNNLEALFVSQGTLNPGFAPGITNYTVNLSSAESAIEITANVPVGSHSTYIIRRAGHPNLGPFTSSNNTISGLPGTSTIFIDVTADSGAQKTYRLTINRQQVQIDMVSITGGAFERGRNLGAGGGLDVTPVYSITVSNFRMSRFQITQDEWEAVMGTNPSHFQGASHLPAPSEVQGRRPVENVSWYDVLVFANKLSILRNLTPAYEMEAAVGGQWTTNTYLWGPVPGFGSPDMPRWNAVRIVPGSTGYRLPTEAQWEFAAKGGNMPGNYTFSGSDNPDAVAWYSANSSSRTREVGRLASNALGIYDMSGNVWEWVWDRFGPYTPLPDTDPTGPDIGVNRVRRGGSWVDSDAAALRSVARNEGNPSLRLFYTGFRLVRP